MIRGQKINKQDHEQRNLLLAGWALNPIICAAIGRIV
jgi:hypothetical protein